MESEAICGLCREVTGERRGHLGGIARVGTWVAQLAENDESKETKHQSSDKPQLSHSASEASQVPSQMLSRGH